MPVDDPSGRATTVVVLGADLLLAAMPATGVQLMHACRRAGFDVAVPASWGDEVIARECAERVAERGDSPAILCACPYVADRLATRTAELHRFLVSVVAPPVAAARYLRALARGAALHITYVGACPSSSSPEIDQHFAPAAFLGWLAERGVELAEQPTLFDALLTPDRRRHHSLPGGLPVPQTLAAEAHPRTIVEIFGEDYAAELAEQLIQGGRVLVDLAPRLGCACAGAAVGVHPRTARVVLTTLEPPRSLGPVVDHSLRVPLALPLETPPESPPASASTPVHQPSPATTGWPTRPPARTPAGTPAHSPAVAEAAGSAAHATPHAGTPTVTPRGTPVVPPPRLPRLTPVGVARLSSTGVPRAFDVDGRRLPRAYVAVRRRSAPYLQAVATPPPLAAVSYDGFVAGIAATVAHEVPHWRLRLGEAIAYWHEQGVATAVLERAYSLPKAPDVEGLLATFAAAVERLLELERQAVALDASLAGAEVFRDPERVAEAEEMVVGAGAWGELL
jgi:hypothetical protein